jgi:mutator protein MutT
MRKQGTAIILFDSTFSKVYLHERLTARDFNGSLAFPGGEVDPGETPAEAAVRELKEETGLVRKTKHLNFIAKTKETKSKTDKWETFWFIAQLGFEEKLTRMELKAGHWKAYSLDELAALKHRLYPGTYGVIRKLPDYIDAQAPTHTSRPFKCALAAVDMAIVRVNPKKETFQVLLGRKKNSQLFRFPGGFVDPTKDNSFAEAAIRELGEEVPNCKLMPNPKPIVTGLKINDSRYKRDKDKVFTSLFVFRPAPKNPTRLKAGDDLVQVKWFDFHTITRQMLVPAHVSLMNHLFAELNHAQPLPK